jgi:hypothetical protein
MVFPENCPCQNLRSGLHGIAMRSAVRVIAIAIDLMIEICVFMDDGLLQRGVLEAGAIFWKNHSIQCRWF